jgi:hypothetical protein
MRVENVVPLGRRDENGREFSARLEREMVRSSSRERERDEMRMRERTNENENETLISHEMRRERSLMRER